MILLILILVIIICISIGAWFFFSTQIDSSTQSMQVSTSKLGEKLRSANEEAIGTFATKESIMKFNGDLKTMNADIRSTLSEDVATLKASDDAQRVWAQSMFNAQKRLVTDELNSSTHLITDSLGKVRTLQEQQQTVFNKNLAGTRQEMQDSLNIANGYLNKQNSNMVTTFNNQMSNLFNSHSTFATNVSSEVASIGAVQKQFIATYPKTVASSLSNLQDQVTGNKNTYDGYARSTGNDINGLSNDVALLKNDYATLSNQLSSDLSFTNANYDMRLTGTQNSMLYLASNANMQFKSMGNTMDMYKTNFDNLSKLSDSYASSVLKSSKIYTDQESKSALASYKNIYDSNVKAFNAAVQAENLVLRQYSDSQLTASKGYTNAQLASMSNTLKQYSDSLYTQMLVKGQSDSDVVQNMIENTEKELGAWTVQVGSNFVKMNTAMTSNFAATVASDAALQTSINNVNTSLQTSINGVNTYAQNLNTKVLANDVLYTNQMRGISDNMTASNASMKSLVGTTSNTLRDVITSTRATLQSGIDNATTIGTNATNIGTNATTIGNAATTTANTAKATGDTNTKSISDLASTVAANKTDINSQVVTVNSNIGLHSTRLTNLEGSTTTLQTNVNNITNTVNNTINTRLRGHDDSITSINNTMATVAWTNSNFVTPSTLNTTLNGYVRTTGLSGYATNAQLSGYATNASLSAYATNSTLSGYATNASLGGYVTTQTFNDAINGIRTEQAQAKAIADAAQALINGIVIRVNDTVFDGLPNNQFGAAAFAINSGDQSILDAFTKSTRFSVDGSQWFTISRVYQNAWFGKHVVSYGSTPMYFQSYTNHTFRFA